MHPRDSMQALLATMATLRDPDTGCPWDKAQTFASIAPYTIEEAYEVQEAIAQGDMSALKEELGDLLLQVVYQAQIGKEAGLFDFAQIAQGINDKMIARHPHVFGDSTEQDLAQLHHVWEANKAAQREAKGQSGALAGVAVTLPALLRAQKLQKRAAKVGFDWRHADEIYAKIREEIAEVQSAQTDDERAAEIGDLLFAVINLARHYRVDAEQALRGCNQKFERRFACMEALASAQGHAFADLTIEQQEALWHAAKQQEKEQKGEHNAH